jgi:hypothetical protein
MLFSSVEGDVQSSQRLHCIMFLGGKEGGYMWCMLLTFWVCRVCAGSCETGCGENGVPLFSRQIFPGTRFSTVGHREAFHLLGVKDIAEFDSG